MLGETLSDPHGVEDGGTMNGMGLLPMETVFAEKKTRTRVPGHFGELAGELAGAFRCRGGGLRDPYGREQLVKMVGLAPGSIADSVSGKRRKKVLPVRKCLRNVCPWSF